MATPFTFPLIPKSQTDDSSYSFSFQILLIFKIYLFLIGG